MTPRELQFDLRKNPDSPRVHGLRMAVSRPSNARHKESQNGEETPPSSVAGTHGNGQASDPTVVACVVFQTQDPERLVELLRQALAGIPGQARAEPPNTASPLLDQVEEPWLNHAKAAEYLGISRTTLYRYAEQERIESSKFGNRLEYRRSSLDRFKDQHVRPARRPPRGRGIILPVLSSGN